MCGSENEKQFLSLDYTKGNIALFVGIIVTYIACNEYNREFYGCTIHRKRSII